MSLFSTYFIMDYPHRQYCNSAVCFVDSVEELLQTIFPGVIPLFVTTHQTMCEYKIEAIRTYMRESNIDNIYIHAYLLEIELNIAMLHIEYLRKTVHVLMACK